jgi:hypothetical protein
MLFGIVTNQIHVMERRYVRVPTLYPARLLARYSLEIVEFVSITGIYFGDAATTFLFQVGVAALSGYIVRLYLLYRASRGWAESTPSKMREGRGADGQSGEPDSRQSSRQEPNPGTAPPDPTNWSRETPASAPELHTPTKGKRDWHVPLNDNFDTIQRDLQRLAASV